MPQKTIDLLNNGTKANTEDKFRRDNLICLPDSGMVIATGDLHGHRRNFERIATFADLQNNPDRHLILQEIIHGGPENDNEGCLSFQLLFEVVQFKLQFPHQVHIIMGNHDTAFINNSKVMKAGKEMNLAMREAISSEFKNASPQVNLAISQFLFSQPLAVRCQNRIWLSHSLVSQRLADKFDPAIFNRPLKVNDVVRPGSAYLLTWGRKHPQTLLDDMAKILDVDLFILGHQAQSQGYSRHGQNLLIIASDHNHGCLLPIDLAKKYTIEQLISEIVPLASIQ